MIEDNEKSPGEREQDGSVDGDDTHPSITES